MIEDALDPRPAAEPFSHVIGTLDGTLAILCRDPAALARNWNDSESVWGNLRDFRHWIERAG